MRDYEKMTKAELKQKRKQLQLDRKDVEDERSFVLGQTGLHLSGGTVQRYEVEIEELTKNIEAVEIAINNKD